MVVVWLLYVKRGCLVLLVVLDAMLLFEISWGCSYVDLLVVGVGKLLVGEKRMQSHVVD